MWRRDMIDKGGESVMVMTRKDLRTKIVKYGKGNAEIAVLTWRIIMEKY